MKKSFALATIALACIIAVTYAKREHPQLLEMKRR